MESMRDINRVMEREIAKGSCPLKLDHIEFGDYSYQEITSKEKLLEVLSYLLRIGDYKQYAGKTILNNVYMDLRGKKPVFKRTKTAMERNNIFIRHQKGVCFVPLICISALFQIFLRYIKITSDRFQIYISIILRL